MRDGLAVVTVVLMATTLTGCASHQPTSSTQGTTVVRNGEVIDVRDVTIHGGRSTGLGSFAGAILGGVAGSAIGEGYGRAAAGIGGALAGSMAGQRLEQSGDIVRSVELSVRMENGDVRSYRVDSDQSFRVGDPVTVSVRGSDVRVIHRTPTR